MKCPKCGYNSFEGIDSCKRCGRDLTEFSHRYGLRPVVRQGTLPLGLFDGEPEDREGLDSLPEEESRGGLEPELFAGSPGGEEEPFVAPGIEQLPEEKEELFPADEGWFEEDVEGGGLEEELPEPPSASPSADLVLDFPLPGEGEPASLPPEPPQGGLVPSPTLRLGALLVDLAALVGISTLFALAVRFALGGQLPASLLLPGLLGVGGLAIGYFTLFHFLLGQTPGKMLFHLELVGMGEEPPSFAQALLHTLGGLLALLPLGLGFAGVFGRADRRGWNDRMAGTRVVFSVSPSGSLFEDDLADLEGGEKEDSWDADDDGPF